MQSRTLLIILILILGILFFGCKDEPSEIGISLISSDLVSVRTFDSQTDSLDQNSSYFKTVIPLGAANRLLIGKYGNTEASSLLRFIFGLADTLKDDVAAGNIQVNKAWIELTIGYVFVDSNEVMDFTVHQVNNSWNSSDFTIDSLPKLSYDMNDISSNKEISDSNYIFNIDPNLVLSWMENAADTSLAKNYGIYIKPTANSSKVLGFQAFTVVSSKAAKLNLEIEKTGSYVDTINGFIFSDVSLVDGELPVLTPGNIAVQSSISVNSIVAFDLSIVPKGAVINSAKFFVQKDTVNSISGSSFTNNLNAYFVEDSTTKEINEGGSFKLIYSSDGYYAGDISGYVRTWVNDKRNQGVLLRTGNAIEGLELFILKGSTAANYSERPRLEIVYTVKESLQ